jgi:hypothetical protein
MTRSAVSDGGPLWRLENFVKFAAGGLVRDNLTPIFADNSHTIMCLHCARRCVKVRQQHGKNSGEKMPSKVLAPLMEATGAPSPRTLSRLVMSAPISVPSPPAL